MNLPPPARCRSGAGNGPPGPPRIAAHKPGAVPLRPLKLGDIYDAAFKIIRYNPQATVGAAVLVAAISMLIPLAITALLTFTVGVTISSFDAGANPSTGEIAGLGGTFAALLLGAVLQGIGLILVSGMIAVVVNGAALGRTLTLEQAWRATRGRRWRLVGLTVVLSVSTLLVMSAYALTWLAVAAIDSSLVTLAIYGLVSLPLFLAGLVWFWVRIYYLPAPILMLEKVGVFGAIRRGVHLTKGQFWRTFGIALLTFVIAQVAGGALALPASILGQVALIALDSSPYAGLVLVLTQAVTTVITTAFVAPFVTSVTALQYLDQRMRKEAYDVELIVQAGLAPAQQTG